MKKSTFLKFLNTSPIKMSNKFIVITGNKNKLREFQQILGDDLENKKLDLTELQGTSNEIIIAKAKEGAKSIFLKHNTLQRLILF